MKTAEEYVNQWAKVNQIARDCVLLTTDQIKDIQLDAWKQGMTDAAKMCVYVVDSMEPRLADTCTALHDSIIRAAEAKKEL
jgi:hypothetical protein